MTKKTPKKAPKITGPIADRHAVSAALKLAQTTPPAAFAKPMYRLVLDNNETSLGFPVIDVLQVMPSTIPLDERNRFPFPFLVCLALGHDGQWISFDVSDSDTHVDLGENYAVLGGER